MTNHYFSICYLTVPPLSEAALRTKSLRKSAERSNSFLRFGSSMYLDTSKSPTAHIIISVLRHFPSRCGLRASPAPRAGNEPTAHHVSR
jgi:hypothetical protein